MPVMRTSCFAVIAAAAILSACAGNPAPGQSDYAYNVDGAYTITIDAFGQPLPGEAAMTIAEGGAVTGAFTINGDVIPVAGAVSADTLTFSSTYERSGGCEGLLEGEGAVATGGDAISGTIEINDSCAGVSDGATFEMTR